MFKSAINQGLQMKTHPLGCVYLVQLMMLKMNTKTEWVLKLTE